MFWGLLNQSLNLLLDPGLYVLSVLPDNINHKWHIQMLIHIFILQAKRHNAIFWGKKLKNRTIWWNVIMHSNGKDYLVGMTFQSLLCCKCLLVPLHLLLIFVIIFCNLFYFINFIVFYLLLFINLFIHFIFILITIFLLYICFIFVLLYYYHLVC